jgi:hypothetical protein
MEMKTIPGVIKSLSMLESGRLLSAYQRLIFALHIFCFILFHVDSLDTYHRLSSERFHLLEDIECHVLNSSRGHKLRTDFSASK